MTAIISATMTLRKITGLVLGGKTGAAVTVAKSDCKLRCRQVFKLIECVHFMRSGEIASAISLMDPETNEVVGTSSTSAKQLLEKETW